MPQPILAVSAEQVVFAATAMISLLGAYAMLFSRNSVHSALGLVLNFFALAVFYVLLDAHFLAAAQVVVYAGAIMVLFLFVIMLLGVDKDEAMDEPIRFQRPLAYLSVGALAALTVLTVRSAFGSAQFTGLQQANASGNVEGLGRLLFSKYLFPFEVTSLLLIVAAIGAMVIGKRRPIDAIDPEEEDD